jgi:hypothetical protein
VSLSTRGNTQPHTKAESTIDPLCTETDEGRRNGRIGHHLGEALIDRPHDAAPEEEGNEESRRTALGQGGPHLHIESFMFRPRQSRSLSLAYVLSGKTYTCQLLLCHVSGVHVKPRAARKARPTERAIHTTDGKELDFLATQTSMQRLRSRRHVSDDAGTHAARAGVGSVQPESRGRVFLLLLGMLYGGHDYEDRATRCWRCGTMTWSWTGLSLGIMAMSAISLSRGGGRGAELETA